MSKEFLAKKAYVDKEIDRLDIKADNIQSTLNVSIQALQDADTQFTKDIASVRQTATMAKSKADANAEAIDTKANANHTHNYAGSSTAGGSATMANALTSKNIGIFLVFISNSS